MDGIGVDATRPSRSRAAGDGARQPTLCVINHNGEAYLPASLGAAVALGDEFAEIILVDDASRDRSVELVRERFPGVRIVRLPANRGPAAARNVALREARTDRVVLVDNDVVLTPGCVSRLLDALDRDPEAAVAVPRVVYAGRPEIVQFSGADSHFIGLQIVHGDMPIDVLEPAGSVPGSAQGPPVRRIGSLISACFLLDRSRLRAPCDFDESFFIYLEDHDFGVRIRGQGRAIVAVPDAICRHGEGTEGLSIRQTGEYTAMRVFCLIRNRWQFILKNYSLRSMLLLAPVFALYEASQLVVVVRKGWFREWIRAAWWTATRSGSILRKRIAVRRTRRIPDRALFVGGPIPFRAELTTSRLEQAGKRALDAITLAYWRQVGRLI